MAEYTIKVNGNRVVFDGHAEDVQTCNAITLICESLKDSAKVIEYQDGYAEFEIPEVAEKKFRPDGFLYIYSNDGSSLLWNIAIGGSQLEILSTGLVYSSTSWIYSGTRKFIGLSTVRNATNPEFVVGQILSGGTITDVSLYIVETDPDPSWHIIDENKETACRTAEANAIRAKISSSTNITYDWVNNKGFADAIESIQVGIVPTGNKELTQQSGTDVTNYATASVQSGSVTLNTPTVNTSTGVVTASASVGTSGWVGSAPSSKTLSLTTQAAKTVTPSASSQTAVAAQRYTTGTVTVAAVPSETKTVDLNMASGNQVVSASSGKWMTSVTVNKPATLLPENIKKDVNIGGVVGTMESGGGKGGDYNIIQTIDGDNCSLAITDANTFTVIPKTVTENGTYTAAADNADGYSQVTVALPVYDGSVV